MPDHGKLLPWRFIVFVGDGRARMGEVLVEALAQTEPNASEVRIETERNRFLRAPVVVGVVSRVREQIPIPVWEQQLSAGAVCQTMLIAAHAMGYVGNWITEWCAYHPLVKDALGLKSGERIAGFLYFGKPAAPLEERVRPDLDKIDHAVLNRVTECRSACGSEGSAASADGRGNRPWPPRVGVAVGVVHRLQEEVSEGEIAVAFGRRALLRIDQFEFVAAGELQLGARLGADANPVEPVRAAPACRWSRRRPRSPARAARRSVACRAASSGSPPVQTT